MLIMMAFTVLTATLPADLPQFTTYKVAKASADAWAQLPDTAVSHDGLVMTVWQETITGFNHINYAVYNSQTGQMTTHGVIPNQYGDNIWPRVIHGEDGEFHATWALRPSGTEMEHTWATMYSHFTGGANGTFSPAETVLGWDTGFPTITYNEKKKVPTLFWEHTYWSPIDIETLACSKENGEWGIMYNVSNDPLAGGRVEAAVPDQNGVWYATWEQKTQLYPPAEIVQIAYNHTRGGEWKSRSIMLTGESLGFRTWSIQPKVAVSPDGLQVYILWFYYPDRTYYGQTITYASPEDTEGTFGPIVKIHYGHEVHKFYDAGLVFHGDRFYFAFINSGTIKLMTCLNGVWSEAQALPGVTTAPFYCKMNSSPFAGLSISWNSMGNNPDVYTAFAAMPVASRISAIESASLNTVREKSLFYHNNYNQLSWVNSVKNINGDKNLAVQFLIYRTDGSVFDYNTPYKTFISSSPSTGFEIVESNLRYRFTEKISMVDLGKTYRYAIIAVDEKGTRSEAVEAIRQ